MRYLLPNWLLAFGLSLLFIFAAVVLFFRPQLATYYTPVTIQFHALKTDKIYLSWNDNPGDRVSLVPIAEKSAPLKPDSDQTWCGLLPPVAIDRLTLIAPGSADFVLDQLILQTRSSIGADTTLATTDFQPANADAGVVTLQTRAALNINPPARLFSLVAHWFIPALVLTLVVLAAIRSLTGVATALPLSQRTPRGLVIVSRLCIAITVLYVLHHETMPAFYNSGDSNWYLWKGGQMAEEYGRFESDHSYLYELCKLPGYSFLYAVIVKVVGYNISTLMLSQHLAFCFALFLLGRALLHFATPLVVCLGLLAIALSPIQLFYCSFVMSESWLMSLTLIAFACLLELAGGERKYEGRWLLAFSLAVAAASMMRTNGIFLALGLVPFYAKQFRLGQISWSRALARMTLSGLLILMPLTLWSVRNYSSRRVLGPQQMEGIMLFQGLTYGGALDPRAPAFEPGYAEFSRLHANHELAPWALRAFLFDQGLAKNSDGIQVMSDLETQLRAIVRQSIEMQPRVYGAAMLRGLYDNVWQPDAIDHINHDRNAPLSLNYFNDEKTQWAVANVKMSNSRHIYDVRGGTSWLARFFRQWNLWYLAYYRTLLIGALIAGFLSLRGQQTQALFYTPYLLFGANILLYTTLIMPYGRYIHVLDCLLTLQIVFTASKLRLGGLSAQRVDSHQIRAAA